MAWLRLWITGISWMKWFAIQKIEKAGLRRTEMTAPQLLMTNFIILAVTMTALWAYCVRIRDVSVIDAFWPLGMVILAGTTALLTDGSPVRSGILLALTALWGLRLSFHLFVRWRGHGIDPRYAAILGRLMDKKGWSFAKASFLQVFAMQCALLILVCLPAQLGQISAEPASIGMLGWIGIAIALTGIVFETVGDAQLTAFRANSANAGKVLDTGLWRYTRHPNYFGDASVWCGIFLVSLGAGGWAWLGVIGPVVMTTLLRRVSGVTLLEKSLVKRRPGYEDYVRRTSPFLPRPPRK
jgi:steroid 5-alpha reductase family enzyme